jgi:hypothetical protein
MYFGTVRGISFSIHSNAGAWGANTLSESLSPPFPPPRESATMQEVLSSPFLFVLGILIITVGVPVAGHYWCQYRKNELDAALKHDMLQRGMTPEEIVTVLHAPAKKSIAPVRCRESFDRVRVRD